MEVRHRVYQWQGRRGFLRQRWLCKKRLLPPAREPTGWIIYNWSELRITTQ
jgi:hypothetical protein